jgi:hypothetical protein
MSYVEVPMSESVQRYEWTDEMDEISGFGGEYEESCRQMVTAGLKWLERNDGPATEFSMGDNVFARIDEEAEATDELRTHMASAVDMDPSPSMLHLCVKHTLYAHEIGFEAYVTRLGDNQ